MWHYRFTRILLFLIFSSYLIIMVLVNIQRVEEWIDPLNKLGLAKTVCQPYPPVCLGSYAHRQTLQELQITLLISVLDPTLPFNRELVNAQRRLSRLLGITFISLPIDNPSERSENLRKLQKIIHTNSREQIYINAYFYDERMRTLERILLNSPVLP